MTMISFYPFFSILIPLYFFYQQVVFTLESDGTTIDHKISPLFFPYILYYRLPLGVKKSLLNSVCFCSAKLVNEKIKIHYKSSLTTK